MSKTLYGYRIGADVQEPDAPQAVKLVPDNKSLVALSFNDNPDEEIEPTRLKSMKEIFDHYKPSKEVELKTEDGETEEFVLKFNSLKDFTKDGIIEQSKTLQNLEEQELTYSRMLDVLQNNQNLKNVLADGENKKEFVELLQTLIEELGSEE